MTHGDGASWLNEKSALAGRRFRPYCVNDMLVESRFVIPAQAGILENQQTGHRPASV
jgi:hypothetical protein